MEPSGSGPLITLQWCDFQGGAGNSAGSSVEETLQSGVVGMERGGSWEKEEQVRFLGMSKNTET